MAKIIEWMKRQRPENPSRMSDFRAKLDRLAWDEKRSIKSIDTLFNAVNDLAEAEVRYYYRRRGTRALVSGITRITAWVLGTIGLLIPLLSGANPASFND